MQTLTHADPLVVAGVTLRSRLFLGTGKYRDDASMLAALKASGSELVTVALRRLDLDDPKKKTILDVIDWKRYRILPNTAGCRTADEAIRIARLARSMGLSDWVKLEPATALSAQLMGATVIQAATVLGLPVSTTHVITGSVMGVGISRKLSAVRWGLGANIILAWFVTIPASGAIAWVAFAILHTAGLRG